MAQNRKLEQMYKEAAQCIEKAKVYLEQKDELSDNDKAECDKFLRQADEVKKRAALLQQVLDAEIEEAKRITAAEEQFKEDLTRATEFKHGGEFIVAIYNYRESGQPDPRLKMIQHKDLAGEVGISGGFLIPTEQQTQILEARGEASFVRRYATIVPMGSRVVQYPSLDYSQGAAGVDAFAGGIIVYYVEENAAITEGQPKFKQINLHSKEIAGYTEIPNGLLRDSAVSLQSYFAGPRGFGGALASKEDYDAINGTGAGKLLGVLNAPAKLTVTRNSATDFKFVDSVTMLSKMLLSGSPRWVINQSVMPKLLQFADAASFNIFVQNAALGPEGRLLGFPIDWTGKNPPLGTQGDVMLIDWSMYLLGDRQLMTMDIDRSFKFQNNQTAFRAIEAIDGLPWLNSVVTLMDGTTQVSPYVVLN